MRALAIEEIPLAGLKPYERNARTHSEAQVGQIATRSYVLRRVFESLRYGRRLPA